MISRWRHYEICYKETGMIFSTHFGHFDDKDDVRSLTCGLLSTATQNFIHARRLVWPWPLLETDRASELVPSSFTASTDPNLVPLRADFTFGKRKKSHGDVRSLECCFSPNRDSHTAHCVLARWRTVLTMDPRSILPEIWFTSLHTFTEGLQNLFCNKADWQSDLQASNQCR